MASYKNLSDDELLPLIKRELFSAIIGDVLDKMGYLHCFLPPRIRPLRDDMVLAGRAMPVLEVDLEPGGYGVRKPFGLMLEALDDAIARAEAGGDKHRLQNELELRSHRQWRVDVGTDTLTAAIVLASGGDRTRIPS